MVCIVIDIDGNLTKRTNLDIKNKLRRLRIRQSSPD